MKFNNVATLGLLSLASASVDRRGLKITIDEDDKGPISQVSLVTAFINTDNGLKVQCWEIGDFIPDSQVTRADGSKGTVRQTTLLGNIGITLFSFAPSVTIFSFGTSEVQTNAVDFRTNPNLFTVKDGLVFVEASPVSGGDAVAQNNPDHYIFADLNGDDWFYFEDTTSEDHASTESLKDHFNVRTVSGTDTTLINFSYERTPKHRVLHEGRCNFAGLKPVSKSSQNDPDAGRLRVQPQEL